VRKFTIKNKRNYKDGSRFVAFACRFKSDVTAELYGREYNAKSIMSTMILESADEILFTITGPDEDEAEQAIREYFR